MSKKALKVSQLTKHSPSVGHFACSEIGGRVYLHGGVTDPKSSSPESTLWEFDPTAANWVKLSDLGPALSHHAVFTCENRYLVFVGGWSGKARVGNLHTFDTQEERWLESDETSVDGFPVGGGLSSHTATTTKTGALVIGRLGGLRTQRRTSAVLQLKGNPEKGFTYHVHEIPVLSRSGHTVTCVRSGTCTILGGRWEPHVGMDHEVIAVDSLRLDKNHAITSFASIICNEAAVTGKRMVASRRYHVAVADTHGRVLVHGGENYSNSKDSQVLSDFGLLSVDLSDPTGRKLCWHNVSVHENSVVLPLYGHGCVVIKNVMYIFGGFNKNSKGNNVTYKVEVVKSDE